MKPERIDYGALIESLADGVAVDWASLDDAAMTEAERRRFGNLKLVARMAELHRTMASDGSATGPVLDDAPFLWGHLRVDDRIAGGAYGDVYIARDTQLDRQVALKLLRPTATRPLDRLLEEARTLARVQHPNVVAVYGADVREGRAGLWMELLEGQTLAAWVRAHGPMGPGEAAAVGRDLCRALAAVHAAGLVHGDIKAQNVMRETGGRIVLMDFGAGHVQGTDADAGTPIYLAPEVLNQAPLSARSDIYSLGVLLFHLLTGEFPRAAADVDGLRAAHAAGSRIYLRDLRPDLTPNLVDPIERALDPDPSRRFATVGEMERALDSAAHTVPGRVPVWPWSTRNTVFAAAAAAAIIAAVVLGRFNSPSAPARSASVAVMPFGEATGDRGHLMTGLTADVLRELQRFDVQVKRTSGPVSEASNPSSRERLGADAFVRGTVIQTRGGDSLRVALMRAGGKEWWSQDYDLAADALPLLARRIAGDVAGALGAAPRTGAPAPPRQTNFQAYEAYLRGRAMAENRNTRALERSLVFYDQAAALDPAYAEPHAGKADSYISLGQPAFGGLAPLEARRLARESALKALELNPDLVEAHTSLGMASLVHDWDWPAAEARFKKAIELNPQYALAHHWYSMLLNDMGRFEEALKEIRTAQSLDPLSVLIHRDVGWVLFLQGRYDEAIAQLRETLTLAPDYHPARTLLARALSAAGQHDPALEELERARPLIRTGAYLSFRGLIEATAGRRAEAGATLARLRQVARTELVSPYYLALIHTALGRPDEALSELERSYKEQDAVLVSVNVDPRFKSLRGHPRFQALVERMRFTRSPA